MKTAFIGQRVRIVGATHLTYLIGKEGTVITVPSKCTSRDGSTWWGVGVDVDGLGNVFPDPRKLVPSIRYYPRLEHLEPILYDGSEPLGEVVRIFNDDGTYNPDGHVPLTVVNEDNEEEEFYV